MIQPDHCATDEYLCPEPIVLHLEINLKLQLEAVK